jgi:hypothetical protein
MDLIRSFLEDEKCRFIGARVLNAFKLPPDRWDALLKDDESRNLIGQFIKDPKCRRLYLFLNTKNLLQASITTFTKGKKAVSTYKMRLVPHDNPKEFIRALAFIEIPKNPITCIHRMLDTVYGPLSKSDANVQRFSKPVGNDIVGTMSDITGSMYVLVGKSQGMTVLTMPPRELLTAERSAVSLHAFEAQIVQWVEQIRRLLAMEFPEGDEYGALDEIRYWRKRRQNLELLKKQLESEEVNTVTTTLEETSPPFAVQFHSVAGEVDEALELATETDRGLMPLHSFLEQIDTVGADMEALTEMFHPVF